MVRWLGIVILCLLLAPNAAAEQEELEQRAAEAFERGLRLFEAEDFMAAAEQFEQANDLVPSASVHYNIARSYELAGLPHLAAQHYRAFLDARAGTPQRRRRVQQVLDELSEELGWISLETQPEGAEVFVGERRHGRSPLVLALPMGEHEVRAVDGELQASRTVRVAEGETAITLRLEAPEPEPEPEPLPEPEPQPEPESRGIGRLHHGLFWGGLGTTVASGVALAVVGVLMLQTEDEYNSLPLGDPREDQVREEGLTLERTTTALWITTGALALVTAIVAIFTDWSALGGADQGGEASAPRVRFALSAGGAALDLSF